MLDLQRNSAIPHLPRVNNLINTSSDAYIPLEKLEITINQHLRVLYNLPNEQVKPVLSPINCSWSYTIKSTHSIIILAILA